jgi:hypothetical protein
MIITASDRPVTEGQDWVETAYEKYRDAGFATPSGKIEIFSTLLPTIGEPPLPEFRAPPAERHCLVPRLPVAV